MKPITYRQLRIDEEAVKMETSQILKDSLYNPSVCSDPGDEQSNIIQWD